MTKDDERNCRGWVWGSFKVRFCTVGTQKTCSRFVGYILELQFSEDVFVSIFGITPAKHWLFECVRLKIVLTESRFSLVPLGFPMVSHSDMTGMADCDWCQIQG